MARSDIPTWLSIDDWGSIMGVNPLHLNQMFSDTLFPNNTCGGPWFQNAFQHSDRVGRDDLAMAIQAAEKEISAEVGYNLMPAWTVDERLNYPHPSQPGVYNSWGTNPRGMFKSIELPRGYMISGGVRTKTLLAEGASITREDVDVDGYQETCKVTVAVTFTNASLIHLYYPAQNGDDGWEIRPIKVNISGGNALITFKAWQISAANQQDPLRAEPLDAGDPHSYETSVDVYMVYNDPGTQIQFMWEQGGAPSFFGFSGISLCGGCGTCEACQFGTQYGCFHSRDARLGLIVPAPGDWDSTTQTFSTNWWSMNREPDQVRIWYYSGFVDQSLARPYADMSTYWKYAVAFYAAAKLDRPVSGCSNVVEFIEKWRMDASYGSIDKGGFTKTADHMANRLGTTAGALYAFQRINQNGIRVNK